LGRDPTRRSGEIGKHKWLQGKMNMSNGVINRESLETLYN